MLGLEDVCSIRLTLILSYPDTSRVVINRFFVEQPGIYRHYPI